MTPTDEMVALLVEVRNNLRKQLGYDVAIKEAIETTQGVTATDNMIINVKRVIRESTQISTTVIEGL